MFKMTSVKKSCEIIRDGQEMAVMMVRDQPIMLIILPIMLCYTAQKVHPYYAQYCALFAIILV